MLVRKFLAIKPVPAERCGHDKEKWFIGNLRGERQEWGLLAGFARQQPPHLAPTTAIPKEQEKSFICNGLVKIL
jgi:hypothetical protein